MKKIMFNDKYGLTEAVLNGKKTQTRRVINLTETDKEYLDTAFDWDLRESVIIDRYAKYKVGEVVAVAQSYYSIVADYMLRHNLPFFFDSECAGWNNKMFVKAEYMPHHIRITNIRVEKLQDISDEDCMAEGVRRWNAMDEEEVVASSIIDYTRKTGIIPYQNGTWDAYKTPEEAFATLIDKVSGKGTWESNPYVFVYEFELVY